MWCAPRPNSAKNDGTGGCRPPVFYTKRGLDVYVTELTSLYVIKASCEVMSRIYTIRQLTKEFAVTARTLRFYEDEKLIAPSRRGQTRLYSGRDRARIILILRGRRLGFSLKDIREVLDMYDSKDGEHAQMVHTRRKFEERIHVLERQKLDIDQALAQLRDGIRDIDSALDGNPPTPWTQFFDREPSASLTQAKG
jgi:DNA-binding transcriptional MerR regulator